MAGVLHPAISTLIWEVFQQDQGTSESTCGNLNFLMQGSEPSLLGDLHSELESIEIVSMSFVRTAWYLSFFSGSLVGNMP